MARSLSAVILQVLLRPPTGSPGRLKILLDLLQLIYMIYLLKAFRLLVLSFFRYLFIDSKLYLQLIELEIDVK